MTIVSKKLDRLVGFDDDGNELFFKAVSSRAAFELSPGHPLGLVTCNDDRSNRPGTHTDIYFDFFVNDRAINFNAYSSNAVPQPMAFESGDNILLGSFEPCTAIGEIHALRSGAASRPAQWIGMGDQAALTCPDDPSKPLLINNCLNNADDAAWAEFPAFDLYLTHLSKPQNDTDILSYPTIQLMANGDVPVGESSHYDINAAALQMTGSCEDWIMWMKLAGDAPAHSGMSLWGSRLTAGK